MKKNISIIFKFLILIACGLGILLNVLLLTPSKAFLYYTIQSNVLCFILYIIIILMNIKKTNKFYHFIKGMVTVDILTAMIVYSTMISNSPSASIYLNHSLESNLVHVITPILVLIDYIAFDKKNNYKKIWPIFWSISLFIYLIFEVIYINLGGTFFNNEKYPYSFINMETNGLIPSFCNCILILIIFIMIGYALYILDNKKSETKK